MKSIYLSLLFLCLGLTAFAQKSNRIVVHLEAGAKYDLKSNGNADTEGFSGYQFFVSAIKPVNENFAAGLGAGVNVYTRYVEYFDNIISYPVYANALYKLPTSGDFVPFIDMKLGYGIISNSYTTKKNIELFPNDQEEFNVKNIGGLYVSPSIGVMFPWDTKALTLSVSYELQNMKAQFSDMSGARISDQTKTHTNTLALRLGFMF
ncbi:MAG: hypothetical protein ACOH2V_11370 [Candidatus Saccharimonadaceae bacterium]